MFLISVVGFSKIGDIPYFSTPNEGEHPRELKKVLEYTPIVLIWELNQRIQVEFSEHFSEIPICLLW